MEIKISKGAFERTVEVWPNEWPMASQTAVIAIGFRNMPKDAFNWQRIEGSGTLTVDVPEAELFSAGLHSMLNDAHASVKFGSATGDDLEKLWAECNALADKRLAGLVAGVVRAGGGGKRLDEETRRAREIAERRVRAIAAKSGEKLSGDALRERAKEYYNAKKRQLHELAESDMRRDAAELDEELAAELPPVE